MYSVLYGPCSKVGAILTYSRIGPGLSYGDLLDCIHVSLDKLRMPHFWPPNNNWDTGRAYQSYGTRYGVRIVAFEGWGPSHEQICSLWEWANCNMCYLSRKNLSRHPCSNGHVVQWETGRLAQRGYTFPLLLIFYQYLAMWGQEA